MKHYWPDVPGLGNVAFSRHALAKATDAGVGAERLERTLNEGEDTNDGMAVIWRELNGLRLVIIRRPTPFRGAKLITTLYLINAQEQIR